jgi:hypothetical protein
MRCLAVTRVASHNAVRAQLRDQLGLRWLRILIRDYSLKPPQKE